MHLFFSFQITTFCHLVNDKLQWNEYVYAFIYGIFIELNMLWGIYMSLREERQDKNIWKLCDIAMKISWLKRAIYNFLKNLQVNGK